MVNGIIIIIQLNYYLFPCQLNSPRANCKVSMSERNTHKVQKRGNLKHLSDDDGDKNNNNNNNKNQSYQLEVITVIIIQLNSVLLYFHANSTALGPITK
jgi:hypothetical protein